ncbi:MAG: hypothetical protein K0R98_1401, partial [Rickettsiaceae bacterium]|nr:hypothetical protein [Rickettsiaceae bacterium]
GQILEMLTKSFPETLKKYSGGAGALLTAGLKYANEHAEERSDKERCVIC